MSLPPVNRTSEIEHPWVMGGKRNISRCSVLSWSPSIVHAQAGNLTSGEHCSIIGCRAYSVVLAYVAAMYTVTSFLPSMHIDFHRSRCLRWDAQQAPHVPVGKTSNCLSGWSICNFNVCGTTNSVDRSITICSDSQAALKAISTAKTTSVHFNKSRVCVCVLMMWDVQVPDGGPSLGLLFGMFASCS